MIELASRRDKALALGPVLVAHGVAAWLLIANSPPPATPSGRSDPVIAIELFDARTPTPALAAAPSSEAVASPPQYRPMPRAIEPARPMDPLDPLPVDVVHRPPSAASQPLTSPTPGDSRSSGSTTRNDTPSGRVTASASSPSTSSGDARAPETADRYPAQVLAWIERHKRYPPRASDRRLEGEAVVVLTLDRRGRLRGVELLQSSGHALLDEAALGAVHRADPFPRPEAGHWSRRRFEVPLHFRPARP